MKRNYVKRETACRDWFDGYDAGYCKKPFDVKKSAEWKTGYRIGKNDRIKETCF